MTAGIVTSSRKRTHLQCLSADARTLMNLPVDNKGTTAACAYQLSDSTSVYANNARQHHDEDGNTTMKSDS